MAVRDAPEAPGQTGHAPVTDSIPLNLTQTVGLTQGDKGTGTRRLGVRLSSSDQRTRDQARRGKSRPVARPWGASLNSRGNEASARV